MAKLGPKSMVGTIYAGHHKTLLYTKYINYGPHRKDFLTFFLFHYKSMRPIDHQGLGQFAPKGLDWHDLSGGAPDVATY